MRDVTFGTCVKLSSNKVRLEDDRKHLTRKMNVCPVSVHNGHFSKEVHVRLDKKYKGNKVITGSHFFEIL